MRKKLIALAIILTLVACVAAVPAFAKSGGSIDFGNETATQAHYANGGSASFGDQTATQTQYSGSGGNQ